MTLRVMKDEPPERDHDGESRTLDSAILSAKQTNRAIENLFADPGETIRFPYQGVHRFVGRIAPGRLVFVMANTGQGKTTFLIDAFDRWAASGLRIDFVGTEQEPDELRTKWACARLGIPADVAVNRSWDEFPNGEAWRERVAEDLAKLDDAYGTQVHFVPDKFITQAKIEAAANRAFDRKSQILIIDHIDRVDTGDTQSEYTAMKALVRKCKELARDCNLVLFVATQVNRKGREGNHLAPYRPPLLHHMQMGGTKEHEADVVLGLWRPIRNQRSNETPEEYKHALKLASDGAEKPSSVLESDTMACVLLKHRTRGNMEGERCKLWLTHGKLEDRIDG